MTETTFLAILIVDNCCSPWAGYTYTHVPLQSMSSHTLAQVPLVSTERARLCQLLGRFLQEPLVSREVDRPV